MAVGLSGLRAWVLQRVTAVYLALFFVYLLLSLGLAPPEDAQALRDWLGQPLRLGLVWLFGMALLLHTWVGLRDVLVDYIGPLWLRLLLMALVAASLLAAALWLTRLLVELI